MMQLQKTRAAQQSIAQVWRSNRGTVLGGAVEAQQKVQFLGKIIEYQVILQRRFGQKRRSDERCRSGAAKPSGAAQQTLIFIKKLLEFFLV